MRWLRYIIEVSDDHHVDATKTTMLINDDQYVNATKITGHVDREADVSHPAGTGGSSLLQEDVDSSSIRDDSHIPPIPCHAVPYYNIQFVMW